MEKMVIDTETQKNVRSGLMDNEEAGSLIKTLIAVSSSSTIRELFEILVNGFQHLIGFSAADMLFFKNGTVATHTRLSYSNSKFYEFLNLNDPLAFSDAGRKMLNAAFGAGQSRQTSASYWLNRMPVETLFCKKETEFKYTYSIPFFDDGCLLALIQFRTNNANGFNRNESELLNATEKLITPVLRTLLPKAQPGAAVQAPAGLIFHQDDQNTTELLKLAGTMAGVKKPRGAKSGFKRIPDVFFPGN